MQQKIILVCWALVQEGLAKKDSMKKPIDIFSGHERSSELTHTLLRFKHLDWLEGDARRESVARMVRWIEKKGVFGALREEEVEKEVFKAGPEYGWIDEDGLDFDKENL